MCARAILFTLEKTFYPPPERCCVPCALRKSAHGSRNGRLCFASFGKHYTPLTGVLPMAGKGHSVWRTHTTPAALDGDGALWGFIYVLRINLSVRHPSREEWRDDVQEEKVGNRR